MKERPLLMSGPLVLATLADRKTQTRRLPRPGGYGQPGDRLWVRETWAYDLNVDRDPTLIPWIRAESVKGERRINYRADEARFGPMQTGCGGAAGRWRPSIHMPRWASRLTLEILEVRTEPLQAITEEDAKAEGLPWSDDFKGWCGAPGTDFYFGQARLAFKFWWIHLHGAKSWYSNPEVNVITFKRVTS